MARHTKRDIRRGDGFIQERTAKDGTIRYQARWPEMQRDGTSLSIEDVRYQGRGGGSPS